MKKILIFFVFLFCLNFLFSSSLIWWFKVKGKDSWLGTGIPFLIYNSIKGERFFLGLNYPDSSDEDIKISENVSFGYILKKGMELNVDKVYTGLIIQSDNLINLKIKEFDLKKLKMRVKTFEGESINKLINSVSEYLYPNKSISLKKEELLAVSESIRKYNSERMKAIEDGLKKFPDSTFLREVYLKGLIEEEDYEKIIDFLEMPQTMREYRTKIYALIKTENYSEALNLLKLIKNKKACDYNNYAILLILSNGNKSEAREYFMKAESLSPKDWRVYFNYALFEYTQENFKKAKEEIVKSVKIKFKIPMQIELFKRVIEKENTLDNKFKNSKKKIMNNILSSISFFPVEEEPSYFPILKEEQFQEKDKYYYVEGVNSFSSKDYYMSEKLLKRYLFHDPLNESVYYAIALDYLYENKYEKALLYTETALLLKHKLLYELLRLELFYRLSLQDEFNSLYAKLKELYPANTDIDRIYKHDKFSFPIE